MKKEKSVSSEVYDKEYYLSLSTPQNAKRKLRKIFKLIKISSGQRVLDIGTGRGEFATSFAKKGALVEAIDYSKDAIEFANRRLKKFEMNLQDKVNFKVMDAKSLNYSDNSFDTILMIDLAEHLYPKELNKSLKEAIRVAKDKSKIVIHTAPNAIYMNLLYFFADLFLGKKDWESKKYDINLQSYFSLKKYLEATSQKFRIYLKTRDSFLYNQVVDNKNASESVRKIAKKLDGILDSSFTRKLVLKTPIKYVLATDIWAVINVRKK